jgi:hypothetical protein
MSPNGRVLLAATRSGLFRSTDGGTTFVQVDAAEHTDVDFNPIDNSAAIASGPAAVSYSIDGGATWQASTGVPSGAGRIEVAYARSQPAVVYASAELDGGSMLRSANGGATFVVVSRGAALLDRQGWYSNALWVDPVDGNHLIVGGISLRQSFDGGSTWTGLSAYVHPDHHVIVANPHYDGGGNRQVFFGGDGGVNVADDVANVSNTGFRSLNNNLGVTQFYGGAANAATGVIVGGTQDNGTLLWTPSSGTSWAQTLGSDGGVTAADAGDPSYFYSETVYLSLYRSSNGGYGWNAISAGISDAGTSANFIAPFVLDPNNPNRMLAGGASLWRSNNVKAAAPSWTAIQANSGNNVSAIAVAAENSDVVWVGRSLGQVYKSTNGAAPSPAFAIVPAPTAGMINRITIHPFDANIVYVATSGFAPANILRTQDGGATWTSATGGGTTALPEVPVNDVAIDPASPNTIYAATEVGVFASLDGGGHWQLPQDGPANVCVDELFWMGSTLVAATHGRGMFAVDTRPQGAPALAVSPATLDFGTGVIGSLGAPQRVTVTNTGSAALIFRGATVTGANAADWPRLTNTCTGSLAPGGTCTLDASFQPTSAGARAADIVLTTNAPTSPDLIHLRGAGAVPQSNVPAPWVSQDVGATGRTGSASLTGGEFALSGAGADIWGAADAFHFVFQPISGNGTIVARIAAVENVNAWTKAGLMIRNDSGPDAAYGAVFVTPSKGVTFQRRTTAGAATTSTVAAGTAPRWLKLARAGSLITASMSADGSSWTVIGSDSVPLGSKPVMGMAITSHDPSQLAKTTVDNVSVAVSAGTVLPAGWATADVGPAAQTGSAGEVGGVFTVKSAGTDIWGTADAFRYAYTPLPNDGSIIARVTDVQNLNAWTKAGIMIRQTIDPQSVHASVLVTPGNGVAFVRRTTAGGTSVRTGVSGAAPRWVRLSRAGRQLTASVSADGSLWTTIGQETIAITGTAWAGLAVAGHAAPQLVSASMDHVAVAALPTGWSSQDIGAPGVKGSSSANGTTFVVSGGGADISGAADAFQFAYQTLNGDGQLVARVTSVDNTNRLTKAGLMIRGSLTANAPYAMMLVSAAAGTSFQSRTASGGLSASISGGAAIVAPEWLKVVRVGNVFTGYQSKDGVTWQSVGKTTIQMGASVSIGLAVTSHDNTKVATAKFDAVASK